MVRVVALMALRSHLIARANFGPYGIDERTYATSVWPAIPDNALTLVDRLYLQANVLVPLSRDGKNRHLLTRAKKNSAWLVIKKLGRRGLGEDRASAFALRHAGKHRGVSATGGREPFVAGMGGSVGSRGHAAPRRAVRSCRFHGRGRRARRGSRPHRSVPNGDAGLPQLAVFAAAALLLSATGIYAMLSYSVSRRTRELAIRSALGARRKHLLLLVLWQGMAPALAGVALGLGASFAITRALSSMLFGLGAVDPTTFALVPLLLLFVALAACLGPGLRAARAAGSGSL